MQDAFIRLLITFFFLAVLYSPCLGQFANITIESGFDHLHQNPEGIGGGLAVFDLNSDGWEDFFLPGGLKKDRLYFNDGAGGFTDESYRLPYFNNGRTSSGAIAGDINNDGCDDLFITTIGKDEANLLLIGDCEGNLENISAKAGITEKGPGIAASFLDYDLDGDLDIYVANYIDTIRTLSDPNTNEVIGFDHVCFPNFFYVNNGDLSFTERAIELGLEGEGCALAALGYHMDNGSSAFYIANDFGEWIKPNELFMYDSMTGKFQEIARDLGLDAPIYGMGIALGDVSNDLDLDLYITNLGANVFYENSEGGFKDKAGFYHIENTYAEDMLLATGWGTFFFDLENDGDLDLFVANGYIPAAQFIATSKTDPNKLYVWEEGEGFTNESISQGIDFPGRNRGCVYSDFDHDGDLDIALGTISPSDANISNFKYQFFQNDSPDGNNFLKILLSGVTNNKDGMGSIVYAYLDNGKVLMRALYSGGTHASQNSKMLHFGLGDAQRIDSLIVNWPNGVEDKIVDIPVNKNIWIEEGSSNYEILGCTSKGSSNYDPDATIKFACKEATSALQENEEESLRLVVKNNKVYIRSNKILKLEYWIYNIIGQVQSTPRTVLTLDKLTQIDLPTILPGAYILLIKSNGLSQCFKFILM